MSADAFGKIIVNSSHTEARFDSRWQHHGTTLTTHSILFSFMLGKFFHPKDLVLSVGIPSSLMKSMNFLTVSEQRKW